MDINAIRQNIRQIEQSIEGRFSHFPQIINASGNENFTADGTVKSALTVTVIAPFIMKFDAGAIEFSTSGGNLLGTFTNPNGAMVRINNAINSTVVNGNGVTVPTAAENATAVWAKALEGLTAEEMMRVMLAALAGKRQGLGTVTEQYMGRDGITPRITLSPSDTNGNGTPIINGAP